MQIRKVKSLTELNTDIHNLSVKYDGLTYSTRNLFHKKKLFLADYSFLDSLSLNGNLVFYSPQVLFFLNNKGGMELFAIHLRTNKHRNSHVVTKQSPEKKLLFAKMHVALADAQSHQFAFHLRLHFMVEAIAIARNNYLGKNTFGTSSGRRSSGSAFGRSTGNDVSGHYS